MFPRDFEHKPTEAELEVFCDENSVLYNEKRWDDLYDLEVLELKYWFELKDFQKHRDLIALCRTAAVTEFTHHNGSKTYLAVTDRWEVGFKSQEEAMLWRLSN